METIKYSSKGLVHGNYWGGGKGAYSAKQFEASTKEELLNLNKKALEDGSLDSGMGYESLIGALLTIKITTTIIVNNKPFVNTEYEEEFIGDLSEEDEDFLTECSMNM